MIIGQVTSTGNGVVNVPVLGQGVSDAQAKGGLGSMLALMTAAYKASDNFGEGWFSAAGSTPRALWLPVGHRWSLGAPSGTGVISLYIAGQLLSFTVATDEPAADICYGPGCPGQWHRQSSGDSRGNRRDREVHGQEQGGHRQRH